ncbi:hypothetical protein [Streptomyces sp. NPDC005017]|uniref:hypothetical protein n=1 Tax=Streptomyces sp. NPDC005017 TaxID=3364706 RepID=UPI003699D71D
MPGAARRPAMCSLQGASAPWSDSLVLRGSMTLPAWVGAAAREPADLDWVVLEDVFRVDPLDPYPYVDGIGTVESRPPQVRVVAGRFQRWAEAADGAGEYEPRRRAPGCRPACCARSCGADRRAR